jgi:hypothetical protein
MFRQAETKRLSRQLKGNLARLFQQIGCWWAGQVSVLQMRNLQENLKLVLYR